MRKSVKQEQAEYDNAPPAMKAKWKAKSDADRQEMVKSGLLQPDGETINPNYKPPAADMPAIQGLMKKSAPAASGGADPWQDEPWADEQDDPWADEVGSTPPEPMSGGRAAKVLAERESTLGFRPFVAGVGGAIGEAAGTAMSPRDMPLRQRISEVKQAAGRGFSESRQEANDEEAQVAKEFPTADKAAFGAGLIATAPMLAVKGARTVGRIGLGIGLGHGLSTGKDAGEVIEKTAMGGITGELGGRVGKYAEPVLDKALKPVGKALSWASSQLTGLPKKVIETYYNRGHAVRQLLDEYGKEVGTAGVDVAREGMQKALRNRQQALSRELGNVLKSKPQTPIIEAESLIAELQKHKDRLNPKLHGNDIAEIDDLISTVRSMVPPNPKRPIPAPMGDYKNVQNIKGGKYIPPLMHETGDIPRMNLVDAHELKQWLMEQAKGSYLKAGQIHLRAPRAARAARAAATLLRKEVNAFSPEVAKLNNQLHELHLFDADLSNGALKRLIKPGASSASYLAAGEGNSPRAAGLIKKVERMTGETFLPEAENLASANLMGKNQLLPMDTTGKSMTRMAVGAIGGGALIGDPMSGLLGAAATSPFALRGALESLRAPRWVINKILNAGPKTQGVMIREAVQQGLIPAAINKAKGLLPQPAAASDGSP